MKTLNSATKLLKQYLPKKFLTLLGISTVSLAGVVWACADYGYDDDYSSFSPESFVAKEYTPFFYSGFSAYYGQDYNYNDDNSNTRFNQQIVEEWYDYFGQKLSKADLQYLLLRASEKGIDSVYQNYKGKIAVLPDSLPQLKKLKINKKQLTAFFDYLDLAKKSETYAASYKSYYYWDEKQEFSVPKAFEMELLLALKKAKDPFIKQRLWFQLVRYYYFAERSEGVKPLKDAATIQAFNLYKDVFPKNMMYYRTLGYVAGRYYYAEDYATSNYLFSLCYNYSSEMKIPAKWSFRPNADADWKQSLEMAKTPEEKITLWHLMGIYYDTERAIPEIIALDPKSEKLDLLLSRVINITESGFRNYYGGKEDSTSILKKNTALVSGIALKNNTSKPYIWNLAAGYLNFMDKNYETAGKFYKMAKTQLPADNNLLMAQYKILDWGLYLRQLKKIDAAAEAKMIEPLNWFANLRDGKEQVKDLRFYQSLNESMGVISDLYKKQGDLVKANIFRSYHEFYSNNQRIEQLKALMLNEKQTAFEKAMLRYYPYKVEDLYFYQATALVFQDQPEAAIPFLEKSGRQTDTLQANPFNMRLNDCHDCDQQMAQSKKFKSLELLRMMKSMKAEIKAGRNVYNNAYLLANAYYNISYYGNNRGFYISSLTDTYGSSAFSVPAPFRPMYLSGKIAEKYYLMARMATKNKEQQARCTFMASKVERNESYNRSFDLPENKDANSWSVETKALYYGQNFAMLARQYADTRFYQEAIQECGYFRQYLNSLH
ncbi:hypothetical protein QG516_17955 [Pedobacter gandavensis]|uniref:hypothetical protein n=1 Tax=Pedobacter gandavensis TaxID=2679963 RepID=UPI00247A0368|nr:hypothetical protein [Pedobacter gandavensis]WGQ08422.1 hypothetical protein QG516_17955 [Pedobacter gandavensis]